MIPGARHPPGPRFGSKQTDAADTIGSSGDRQAARFPLPSSIGRQRGCSVRLGLALRLVSQTRDPPRLAGRGYAGPAGDRSIATISGAILTDAFGNGHTKIGASGTATHRPENGEKSTRIACPKNRHRLSPIGAMPEDRAQAAVVDVLNASI